MFSGYPDKRRGNSGFIMYLLLLVSAFQKLFVCVVADLV